MAAKISDDSSRFSRVRIYMNGRLVAGRPPAPAADSHASEPVTPSHKDSAELPTGAKTARRMPPSLPAAGLSRPETAQPSLDSALQAYRLVHRRAGETLERVGLSRDAPTGESTAEWVHRSGSASRALVIAHVALMAAGEKLILRAPRLLAGGGSPLAADRRALTLELQRVRQHVLSLFQAIEKADNRLDAALKALTLQPAGSAPNWSVPDPFAGQRRTLEVPLGHQTAVLHHLEWWAGKLEQLTEAAKLITHELVPLLSRLAVSGAPPHP